MVQDELRQNVHGRGVVISRLRIGRIMRAEGIISSYTLVKYTASKTKVNNDLITNHVDREFDDRAKHEVIVSDLTYVRVGLNWNTICTIIDLYNREIIGYSCGSYKDAKLVYKAFSKIKTNLNNVEYFQDKTFIKPKGITI